MSILCFRLRDNSVYFHECSPLFGRYFYNMYIITKFENDFPLISRTPIDVHVYIISDFPITYRTAAVLCQ